MISESIGAESIELYSEEYRPYQYRGESGRPEGFGVDLITALFDRAGITIKGGSVKIYPWTRAYRHVLKNKNTGLFMTTRTPQREDFFKWVGPLTDRKVWLYKLRTRSDIKVRSIQDAKQYLVGGYDAAHTDTLKALLFPKIDITLSEKQNVKKLLAGRVDLIPSLELTVRARLKSLGESYKLIEKVIVLDADHAYYLALNQEVSTKVVQKLQKSLDDLKQNGEYDKLSKPYMGSNYE